MKEQNALPTIGTKRLVKISPGLAVCLKCLITVWALSGESLSLMLSGYSMDVPGVKYIFTVLDSLDGWGIENLFMALGLGTVFYLVRDRQKNPGVTVLSLFFAICTVFGISYAKTDSWDCIFLFKTQFLLALFVMLGYYFAYKNCILFVAYMFEQKKEWLRRETKGKLEDFLFEKRPFGGALLGYFVLGLPWLISFFPGTLQWDAHAQLWMDLGVVEKTGHFPVAMTEYMGACMNLGRILLHSDTAGLFFYTGTQFTLQIVVFSYANYVLCKLKAPVILRWFSVIYWGVFPYFPIWGYTMVKDTMYYIFVMLWVVAFIDILSKDKERTAWWQWAVFVVSALGIVFSRNDGRYVVVLSILAWAIIYRKYWKLYLISISLCLVAIFLVDEVYMPAMGIAEGAKGEMLSIPLQQTARYLREHLEDVTPEEAEVLQRGFTIDLEQIANVYNPVISDSVKGSFVKHPDGAYLKAYFKVWFQQLLKHPDTYVQAFLNQVYGYFYPNVHNYGDYLGVFYIGNGDKWHDGTLDIEYVIENNWGRRILEEALHVAEKTPVIGLLLSAGLHVYLLLGQCTFLFVKRKRKDMAIFIPEICVLLICIASPVNAYLRYLMPVMVLLPVTAAWCFGFTDYEEV